MPGDYRGEFLLPFQFTCPDLIGKILRDFPEITHASSDRAAPCPCGSYKVLLLLDSAAYRTLDGRDFHLTRQDNNGMWSHKVRNRVDKFLNLQPEQIFRKTNAGLFRALPFTNYSKLECVQSS